MRQRVRVFPILRWRRPGQQIVGDRPAGRDRDGFLPADQKNLGGRVLALRECTGEPVRVDDDNVRVSWNSSFHPFPPVKRSSLSSFACSSGRSSSLSIASINSTNQPL